ncbi:MAG: NADP-dependent malic enzyme [Euryarchaeota archaeon]|nr:NADP-dependent malic enzyme [Euryarchaeota archaeon]
MSEDRRKLDLAAASLEYHERSPRGKVRVMPTKPHATQRDLTLAYSPGVAYPCLEIEKNPEDVYRYTSKGNLVAVISNGSAVLGLGDIGPLASKPVMEGKGLLFKTFADIDVFDIEIDATNVDEIVDTVIRIAPTFGGINLEDIKAPECFEVERRIAEGTDIPVFHDDQHGTAIISGAALLNAAEIIGRSLDSLNVVIVGAGASAIACGHHYIALGVDPKRLKMVDSKGILTRKRLDAGELNEHKAPFVIDGDNGDLTSALVGADVMLGLSRGGLVTSAMIEGMSERPIIFALANPDPEILPDDVLKVRPDAIVATGRSDYPNQVNNVLGFPFIFRGALDVRARDITQGMKMAATTALSALAKEPVPEDVLHAYGGESLKFGPEYIIPKPFDRRVLLWEATAVAEAAVAEGVAKVTDFDAEEYRSELEGRLGLTRSVMRTVLDRVKNKGVRLVFFEGAHPKILRAAAECLDEGICTPILLGSRTPIQELANDLGIDLAGMELVDPRKDPRRLDKYADALYARRARKGVTHEDAARLLESRPYFASQMVASGDAEGLLGGVTRHYPEVLRPCMQTIGIDPDARRLIGCYMMTVKNRVMFIADATVNRYPDEQTLAQIAVQTASVARRFGIDPIVAMLSFSNFGSAQHLRSDRIEKSIELAREMDPTLVIDGPMQADTALVSSIQEDYTHMVFNGPANVLICPNLSAANISYKLLDHLGDADMTGPILSGLAAPVCVLQRHDDVREIVHMAAICAEEALLRR